jgi:hypothetical protein
MAFKNLRLNGVASCYSKLDIPASEGFRWLSQRYWMVKGGQFLLQARCPKVATALSVVELFWDGLDLPAQFSTYTAGGPVPKQFPLY